MGELLVRSLEDVLVFEDKASALLNLDHETSQHGESWSFKSQVVTADGVSIGYLLGRVIAGVKVPRQVIERGMKPVLRTKVQSGVKCRLDEYVPACGRKYVQPSPTFKEQLEFVIKNETNVEIVEAAQATLDAILAKEIAAAEAATE